MDASKIRSSAKTDKAKKPAPAPPPPADPPNETKPPIEILDIRDPKQRLQSYQNDWERTEEIMAAEYIDSKELSSAIKLRLDIRKQVASEMGDESPEVPAAETPRRITVHRAESEA